MDIPRNELKHALARGETLIGFWLSLCSNISAEALSHSGYDWLLIDTEHTGNDTASVLAQLQAMAASGVSAIVRPAWNDPVRIKRLIDIGVQSFLVPYIETADQARAAVEATRYPPNGVRGMAGSTRANRYGRVANYFEKAQSEICVLVQVESRKGYDNVDEIIAVDGVDCVFVGPGDLSASLGHLGDFGHPVVKSAITDILERCKAAGKPAGFLCHVEEDAQRWIEAGFSLISVGGDVGLLVDQADALLKRFKET